jgi:Uma2 family endonuclease
MSAALKQMTVDEFLSWAEGREGRWELHDGEPVMMSPERVGHNRNKLKAATALQDALGAVGLPCEVFTDGLAIRIDARTTYEPDASIACGPPTPADAVEINNPIIVVEAFPPARPRSITAASSAAISRSRA